MSKKILQVEDVHTYVSGFHILQGVSFTVEKGSVTVILGRNGVGKSTLLRTIIGILKPNRGKILFKEKDITGLPSHQIINLGIGFVAAEKAIFGSLKVEENLRIAFRGGREEYSSQLEHVFNLFPDLKRLRSLKARNLSGGQQKMLAIACGIIRKSDLLIMDEPSEGLSPVFVKKVVDIVRELREEGTTILLVEQNFNVFKRIVDKCYLMDKGQIVYGTGIEELLSRPEILKQYLGVSA